MKKKILLFCLKFHLTLCTNQFKDNSAKHSILTCLGHVLQLKGQLKTELIGLQYMT